MQGLPHPAHLSLIGPKSAPPHSLGGELLLPLGRGPELLRQRQNGLRGNFTWAGEQLQLECRPGGGRLSGSVGVGGGGEGVGRGTMI